MQFNLICIIMITTFIIAPASLLNDPELISNLFHTEFLSQFSYAGTEPAEEHGRKEGLKSRKAPSTSQRDLEAW